MTLSREVLCTAPAGFATVFRVPFHHVDAAGLVFYARLFDWFHDVYVAYLERGGMPLHELLAQRRFVAPLVHAEADYLSPLRFGDQVELAIVAAVVTETKVQLGFRVRIADGSVAAVGQVVHVAIDPDTFVRRPLPDDVRTWLSALSRP